MIQQLIQNMLGDYAKFITPLDNGQIRLSIPKDIKDVNSEIIDTIDLTMQDAINLYNIIQQPKQYTSNGVIIKENDTEFDINKWTQLAISEFKNK